jgi:Sensors of blue-light using FAD
MLRRLAWSSVPSASFDTARLNEIIAPSRRNNERSHISGMLLFTGAQFLGILEGDDRDLERLWLRLENDTRHTGLIRIGEEPCGDRWFPEWMMAYTDHEDVGAKIDMLRAWPSLSSKWSDMIRPIMMHADSM